MRILLSTVSVIALLASLGLAQAQTPPAPDPHHPDAAKPSPAAPATSQGAMGMEKMMGGNMEQMMSMMMRMMRSGMMGGVGMPEMGPPGPRGRMAGLQRIEGQIAFYRAELHITDAQAPQWNAFADKLRAGAKRLQETMKGMMQGTALPSVSDQLTRRRQLLTAELETLQGIEPAAALYGVLSADQKKTADELMADHLRRM